MSGDRLNPVLDAGAFDVISFDCYGTLIDWERGILDSMRPVLDRHRIAVPDRQILESYARSESSIESGPYQRYADVLRGVVRAFARELAFEPDDRDLECLVDGLANWPPFPDTPSALRRLRRGFDLAVISNVDEALFARTAMHFPVPFDWVITAERVAGYKPSKEVFERALQIMDRPRERVLHVAQSLYHDVRPASELGISTVWVNRRKGQDGAGATPPADAVPDVEVASLDELVALARP